MKFAITATICLWLAGGLQAVAPRLSILGAHPDFLLMTVVVLSMFTSRPISGMLGFAGGVLNGALVGTNMGGYIISRALVGFGVGWISNSELNKSLYIAPFVVLISTLVGQAILLFISPTPAIGAYLLATIGTAIYNGVIALPVFALLRWFLDSRRR